MHAFRDGGGVDQVALAHGARQAGTQSAQRQFHLSVRLLSYPFNEDPTKKCFQFLSKKKKKKTIYDRVGKKTFLKAVKRYIFDGDDATSLFFSFLSLSYVFPFFSF